MSIERHGTLDGKNGLPIISMAVAHGDLVYVSGVVPDPEGDITAQTRQVLGRIDRWLEKAGTGKSKLLSAQVWLKDMADFAAMNAVWNAWVDPKSAPARACVRADLFRPELRVEIMVTAAK